METLTTVYEAIKPYFAVIALVLTWAGFGYAWWRERGRWLRREFLTQVNFSLNLFGDTLAMRTLLEVRTTDVWPNAHGVRLLHAAAARTTEANPFIQLAAKEDRAYLHRSIKNALSQLCPAAFVAAALGEKVRTGTFLFAVTCERYPEMETIKLRVLLVERNTLRDWCAPGEKAEQLSLSGYYRTRVRTLQAMYEMDRKARAGGPEELGRVELGFPIA